MKRLRLNTEQLKAKFPNEYDFMLELLQEFAEAPHNNTSNEDVANFKNGNYLAEIWTNEDETKLMYAAGRDERNLNSQPPWGEDDINDVPQDVLELIQEANR